MSVKSKELKNEVKERAKEQEALHREMIENQANTDKAKKDLLLRTITGLEQYAAEIRAKIDQLSMDYNVKVKVNENLGISISLAQAELSNLNKRFEQENQKRLELLEKQMREMREADSELQSLLKSSRDKAKSLDQDRALFEQEREANRKLVHAAQTALDQNNAQWNNREADLLEQQNALEVAKQEFEAYKESLKPEIARITAIKNENLSLIQTIETEKANVERIRLESLRLKDSVEQAKILAESKANSESQKHANTEARLRKWEQDLSDYALELKVKDEEAQKMMKRYQLAEKIEKK